jgi:hypothetical protein
MRGDEEMKPPSVKYMTHEEVVDGKKVGRFNCAVFSLCGKGDMDRAVMARAIMAWRRLRLKPSQIVIIHVAGYDDDPRELWQIDEVRAFVQKFCAKTGAHSHPAIDPMSRSLLLACGADPSRTVSVNMISEDAALAEFTEWIKNK